MPFLLQYSWFYATNYGAALTSFALTHALASMEYTSTLIDIPKQFWSNSDHLRMPLTFSKRFIHKYCNVNAQVDLKSEADMTRLNRSCKAFAVASDQLWRWDKIQNVFEFFFLGFADSSKTKFSYATSFGGANFGCDDEAKLVRVKEFLSSFKGVSVREKNGVQICKSVFGIDAAHVMDPVFLCDASIYEELAEQSKLKGKKYVTAYMLAYSAEKERILKAISELMQREIILIPDATIRVNNERSGVSRIGRLVADG